MSYSLGTALLLALFLLLPSAVWAQSGYDLHGSARATALGHATTALASDAGLHVNPAVRATYRRPAAVLFARQSFGLAELRTASAHLTLPTRWAALSAGAGTFGFEAYREVHLSASVARSFALGTTRRLAAGVALRYHHTAIRTFESHGTPALNAGLHTDLLPTLALGIHATNLTGAALGAEGDLPETLAVGLAYTLSPRFAAVADVFKDTAFPLSLRGGVEVRPVDVLALRAGAASAPRRFTAGAGVRLTSLSADLAAEQHPDLGWSPAASLGVQW